MKYSFVSSFRFLGRSESLDIGLSTINMLHHRKRNVTQSKKKKKNTFKLISSHTLRLSIQYPLSPSFWRRFSRLQITHTPTHTIHYKSRNYVTRIRNVTRSKWKINDILTKITCDSDFSLSFCALLLLVRMILSQKRYPRRRHRKE